MSTRIKQHEPVGGGVAVYSIIDEVAGYDWEPIGVYKITPDGTEQCEPRGDE